MDFALEPQTDAGNEFARQACEHAGDASRGVADRDRTAEFPHAIFDAMRTGGFLAATVPVALGGGGLTSLHDLTVGMVMLAQADASTALAANNTDQWSNRRSPPRLHDDGSLTDELILITLNR